MKPNNDDIFSDAAAYEIYVGRWSRLVAERFVAWLEVAPNRTWLDVGVGTGVLSQVILHDMSPIKVVGIDSSPAYVDFARQHIRDNRVDFRVGDATNLAFESPAFDVAVSGLVINFVPSPKDAINGMMQAVKQGGIVAAYVWDYSGGMEMMRHFWDAAIIVDPSAAEMDSGQRFSICDPDQLRALFESVGLDGIEVIPIDVPMRFKNFDDYWLPFLGAQGSVSKYLHGLDDVTRNAIRDQLREQLPTSEDGQIPLVARAWAVKGTKVT
jgi:ubiquinone/menaquinone biosynthesis C-methylase UbiE